MTVERRAPSSMQTMSKLNVRAPWFALVQVLFLALIVGSCGDSKPAPKRHVAPHKLLIVGWDGATVDMVDPLIAAGRLPNVKRLIERGSSARLESTKVPISSAAWVGAVTGCGPGVNGVYSFFEPIENSYDVKLISSRSNRATPLWRILNWNGMRSIVFNVPVTYPPEPIDGVIVGGMLSPFEGDFTHPKSLAAQLRARGFTPDLGAWREKQAVDFELVKKQLPLKRDIVLEMLRDTEWDMAMVVFKDLDVWCHRAYDGRTDTTVAEHYELLDGVLGELVAQVGEDTDVILMSDHGFASYRQSFFIQRWLVDAGFAKFSDAEQHRPAPTQNLAERRAMEHQVLLGMLDLEHTVAFPGAVEANFGGVRLNVRGREPKGALDPERVDATLTEISNQLLAWRAPGRDAPVVTHIYRSSELYPGPYSSNLPDLIFELDPMICARPEPHTVPFARQAQATPDHSLYGVFAAAGPSFAQLPQRAAVSVFDLAPTALALLRLPVYEHMTGAVRTELFRGVLPATVVRESDDPAAKAGHRPSAADFSDTQTEEVKSRLAETGYAQ